MLEPDSILVRLPFRLSPSDVCNSLAQESNHERVLALDFESVSGEKLRYPLLAERCRRSLRDIDVLASRAADGNGADDLAFGKERKASGNCDKRSGAGG